MTVKSRRRNKKSRSSEVHYESLETRRVLAQMLPDMFAWASESRGYLYDYVVEGNLLRFSTALANYGPGNLEIRGGAALPNGNQEVYQRIYNDDGTFQDRLAGEFTYHPSHGHIHFDGYAIYNLREKLPNGDMGDVVATGGKVSFCLIDIAQYDSSAGSSEYHSCGQVQGVTAGWSDVYNRSLPDQWINITGVPDGDYFLEVIVDPYDQLLEADETNNVTVIPVTIGGATGGTGGDRYESNNTPLTATNLGMTDKFNFGGLSIHEAADVDYFQIVAPESDHMAVEINFTNSLGNLDLFVYDSNQNLIASSETTADNEELEWEAVAGETYFIKVAGVDGDTNGYEIYIHGHSDLVTYVEYSEDTPVSIPDAQSFGNPGAPAISTLVGPNMIISDLNLLLDNIEHTYLGDLRFELTSPSGTIVKVISSTFEPDDGPLGSQDNFLYTTIDDQAPTNLVDGTAPFHGSFHVAHSAVPANPLSLFNGENAEGVWTLTVTDWAGSDTGTIRDWGIMFNGVDQNPGDAYELNDQIPQATYLGVAGQLSLDGLTLHRTNDVDVFRFIAGVSGTAAIDLAFTHSQVNADFKVYDSNLDVVAIANSDDDNEHLALDVVEGGLYYIEVFSSAGIGDYSVAVDLVPTIGDTAIATAVSTEWQTIYLPRTYNNPVIITGPSEYNLNDPTTIRIRNVTSNSFEIRFEEWDYQDGQRASEDLSYMVVEAGVHTLHDGRVLTAGKTNVNGFGSRAVFGHQFDTKPIIFTQVLSDNNSSAVISRVEGASQRFAKFSLQQEEANGVAAVSETVGWIALESGASNTGITEYEAGVNSAAREKQIRYGVRYSKTYSGMPAIFAETQSLREVDPFTIQRANQTNSSSLLVVAEERSKDSEIYHFSESMGWGVFDFGPLFGSNAQEFNPPFLRTGDLSNGAPITAENYFTGIASRFSSKVDDIDEHSNLELNTAPAVLPTQILNATTELTVSKNDWTLSESQEKSPIDEVDRLIEIGSKIVQI
ncbi:MAG: lysyl oxidase family protein [Pirellulaceae bacterium]